MTHIKICGISKESHALAAAEAGADFIGLVFAPSPRQVTPDQAKKIAAAVKESGYHTEVVGVFVNTPSPELEQVADFCSLDWVQLSGDESWEYCTKLTRPTIKAVRIGKQQSPENICNDLAEGVKALSSRKYIFLLDSHVKDKYGGTGMTFDWNLARPAAEQYPVIMAGGLTPENITRAIDIAAPLGVDVSSGVETDGAKDITKIQALIEAVRRTDGK